MGASVSKMIQIYNGILEEYRGSLKLIPSGLHLVSVQCTISANINGHKFECEVLLDLEDT